MKKNRKNQAWRAWSISKRLHELGKKVEKEIKGLRIPFYGQREFKIMIIQGEK